MNYPMIDTKATGAKIKGLRKEKHLKVRDVARYMGFEYEQAVYKWERGDSLPTVENLYALSRLLEVSIDSILIGCEEKDESPSSEFYCRILPIAIKLQVYYFLTGI